MLSAIYLRELPAKNFEERTRFAELSTVSELARDRVSWEETKEDVSASWREKTTVNWSREQ